MADADRVLSVRLDYVSAGVLADLQSLYAAAGQSYLWHDQKGVEYQVLIRSLEWGRIRAQDAYRVEMELAVLEGVG